MGVAHFAIEFGLGNQGCDGVDYENVDSTGTDQSLGDLKRLFAAIWLRNQEVIDVDAEFFGVGRVEGVFSVDKCGETACSLGLGDDLQGDGGLAGRLGAEDLNDAAARDAADAKRRIE